MCRQQLHEDQAQEGRLRVIHDDSIASQLGEEDLLLPGLPLHTRDPAEHEPEQQDQDE